MNSAHHARFGARIAVCIAFAIISFAASADVIHVPGDHPTIQQAIDAAAQAGDEIIVAPGVYNEAINLLGKEVYLHSLDGRDVTTMDGTGLNTSVVTCVTGETSDTIIEGFTITGGMGSFVGGSCYGGGMYNVNSSPSVFDMLFVANSVIANSAFDHSDGSGGAICNVSASPAIVGCEFRDNLVRGGILRGRGQGGAIANLEGSDATIAGCTFVDNLSESEYERYDWGFGGAIYNHESSPHISSCSLNRNVADAGGAISSEHNPSAPVIVDCDFTENKATGGGGAIRNYSYCHASISRCSFTANSAKSGGAMLNSTFSFVSVVDCVFARNTASYGAGIYSSNIYGRDWGMFGCTFIDNKATSEGGGIRNWYAKPLVINCLFKENSAREGGGMYNEYNIGGLRAVNCTFVGNNAEGRGGAMRNYNNCSPDIINCAFYNNVSPSGPHLYSSYNSDPVITASNIPKSGGSGNAWDDDLGIDGGGNIDANPMFVDPADGNFLLRPGSPCIDAGNNDALPPDISFDLNGDPRYVDSPYITDTGNGKSPVVDMGCYEFQANEHPTLVVVPDPLIAGTRATFTVTNARGDAETFLFYSLTGPGRRIVTRLNIALNLDLPRRIRSTVLTNETGFVQKALWVPVDATGLDLWFQAGQRNVKTDVVETTVVQ